MQSPNRAKRGNTRPSPRPVAERTQNPPAAGVDIYALLRKPLQKRHLVSAPRSPPLSDSPDTGPKRHTKPHFHGRSACHSTLLEADYRASQSSATSLIRAPAPVQGPQTRISRHPRIAEGCGHPMTAHDRTLAHIYRDERERRRADSCCRSVGKAAKRIVRRKGLAFDQSSK